MNFFNDESEEKGFDENMSEEQRHLATDYLTNRFLELEKSDLSKKEINNLIKQFKELKKNVIETKNNGEYRTKELRSLFKNLITLCDERVYIHRIIKLTEDGISDNDFDNRDIKFVDEITNIIFNISKILYLKDLQGLGEYPLKLLELIEKLHFIYFKSFGIKGSIEDLFVIYNNLFYGNPNKIKLPANIDPKSNQTFFYELKPGEHFDRKVLFKYGYFNFQFYKLDKKFFPFSFDSWFKDICNHNDISIPINEKKYPNFAKAFRTKSPRDLGRKLEKMYKKDKENYETYKTNIRIFNANNYFLISDQYEIIWNKWNKQFFNSYQKRFDIFRELSNLISDDDTDTECFDKNLKEGFVYLIRNQDIYKIGITENLLNRMSQLEPDEIIDTIKCSNFREVERELHREYKDCRIPQTEYFRLDERQVLEVSRKLRSMAE